VGLKRELVMDLEVQIRVRGRLNQGQKV